MANTMKIIKVAGCHECPESVSSPFQYDGISQGDSTRWLFSCDREAFDITENVNNETLYKDCPLDDEYNRA